MSTPPPPPGGNDPYDTDPADEPGEPGQSGYGQTGHGQGAYNQPDPVLGMHGQPGYGGQGGQGQPGYGAPGYGDGSAAKDNQLGVWALVTGILGLCCGPVGVVAIILGLKSKEAAARGTASNGGLGQVGFVLGLVAVALWTLALVLRWAGVIDYDV